MESKETEQEVMVPFWRRQVSNMVEIGINGVKDLGRWATDEPRDAVVVAGVAGCAVIALNAGVVLVNAVALAGISTAAFGVLIFKAPPQVQRFLVTHDLATDAGATLLTYVLLGGGGGLTVLMASGMTCLFVSGILKVAKPIILNGYIPAPQTV